MLEGQLPALTWTVFAAWALGCVLLALIAIIPAARTKTTPLCYLMASELLILAIGVLPWHLPWAALGIALTAAGARIGFEAGHVYGLASGRSVALPFAAGLAAATAFISFAPPGNWFIRLAAAVVVAAALWTVWRRDWRNTAAARFLLYPAIPFLSFAVAGRLGNPAIMVLAFLFVELFDSFSLLGGKLFGRNLLVPRLSPRKTWEGLATGLMALAVSSWLIAIYLEVDIRKLWLLALVTAVSALAGDLTASAIKRKAGVKDYPAILPVQGGLLDIVDSWIVAAPLMMLAVTYLG